jgi:hypothetical protein
MRRGPLAGLACAALLLAVAGCGTKSETVKGTGAMSWTKKPTTIRLGSKPKDRILFGTVRNDSLRPVKIYASDIRVVDSDGRPLEATAIFSKSFAHGLYGSTDPRAKAPGEFELARLGRLIRLNPGQSAPLTVSWRLKSPSDRPVQVQMGDGALPIP